MLKKIIEIIKFIMSLFANNGNVIEGDGADVIIEDPIDTYEPETDDNYDYDEPEPEQEDEQEEVLDYSDIMVHIDNGHAKETAGKRTPWCSHKVKPELVLYEYESNRIIANLIKEGLEKMNFLVDMVVPEVEKDIKLTQRYSRANVMKGKHPECKHIFISVHSNAHGHGESWTSAEGWEAYTTKGQNNSDKLADCLYDAAERILKPMGRKIRTQMSSDGDRDYEENFTVIWGANMPAVLTESLFYTNIEDTKFLLSEKGQRAIAEVHIQGIKAFCDKYYRG